MRMIRDAIPVFWVNNSIDILSVGYRDLTLSVQAYGAGFSSSCTLLGKCLSQPCMCDLVHALGPTHILHQPHWIGYSSYFCFLVALSPFVIISPIPPTIFLPVQSSKIPALLVSLHGNLAYLPGFLWAELRWERKTSPVLIAKCWGCVFQFPSASVFPPVILDSDNWPASASVYKTCLEIFG